MNDPLITQDNPRMKLMTLRSAEKAKDRKAAKEASRTFLDGGAQAYLDSPPGIGFVLEFPNGWKKYYVTSEQAKEFWEQRYRVDHGIANAV